MVEDAGVEDDEGVGLEAVLLLLVVVVCEESEAALEGERGTAGWRGKGEGFAEGEVLLREVEEEEEGIG